MHAADIIATAAIVAVATMIIWLPALADLLSRK